MMTTRADFGFQPKKKLITYGRASKKFGRSSSPLALSKKEPSTLRTDIEASAAQRFGEASSTIQRLQADITRKTASRLETAAPAVDRKGAPLAKKAVTSRAEEEAPRTKKRKVAANVSSDIHSTPDVYDVYSPPSSPPRLATPIKNIRPKTTKKSSSAMAGPSTAIITDRPVKDVYDIDELNTPFSLKTSKTLRELSIDNASPQKAQNVPLRLSQTRSPRAPRSVVKAADPPVRKVQVHELKPSLPTRRGKRLIDALAAQVEESSEDESISSQPVPVTTRSKYPLESSPPASQAESSQSQSHSQNQSQSQSQPRTLQRQVSMTGRKAGPKFTYSQQRTMLAEESVMSLAAFDDEEPSQKRPAFLGLGNMHATSNLSAFSFADDEDDTGNAGAVQSLHELRQAGANQRSSEDIGDIMQRVGKPDAKPSSLRRGALLELAQKMKEADFRHQFRSNDSAGNLFKGLEGEGDLVACYVIASILTTLLATSLSPSLILQIQPQGISHLLLLLLGESSDISVIAKERKRNASRITQLNLAAIKGATLKLPVWEPASPTSLSPRKLALKALDLLIRQLAGSAAESEVFSPALTNGLFEIVSDYENASCWDFPAQAESVDFYLALHLLENHSVSAMQSTTAARWSTEYLPTVAGILGVALQRPVDKFDDLEASTLKLTLNMTNNNHETPAMFVSKGLLRDLGEAACRTFDVVNRSILDDAFLSKVYDSLILMLGVMINFCEHYAPAAQDLMDAGDGEASPLNRLIRVFLDYHAVHADADSMEKTQLNVAFGYLAILLGHLCLHRPIRERFMTIYAKRNLEPLLDSIRIFITLHRVTLAAMEGESSSTPDANAADRLQSLVDQLESQS